MDVFLNSISGYGVTGCLVAVLIYDVFFLQRKLIAIIESNTKAIEGMTSQLAKCQDKCNKV